MTIQTLQKLRPLLNLAEVARRAGMPEQTLFAKVRRGTELTEAEARAIQDVLEPIGAAQAANRSI